MALARGASVYTFATLPSAPLGTGSAGLGRNATWFQIKGDRQATATSVYVIQWVIGTLRTILAPRFKKLDERVSRRSTRGFPISLPAARRDSGFGNRSARPDSHIGRS
jgi:hypothetical protein